MAKMACVGFVFIMFTGKIPFMSSHNMEKGKGTNNKSEKGHDNNTSTSKSPSKYQVQSSSKSDFGTPLDGEVLFTYVSKSYSQELDLKVIELTALDNQPPQPIIQARKDRVAKKKATSSQFGGEILAQPPKMPLMYHHAYN
jgi:hypothetical protein